MPTGKTVSVKANFKGRQLLAKVERAKTRELYRAGGFIQTTAKRSMKKAPKNAKTQYGEVKRYKSGKRAGQTFFSKGRYSRPGSPPFYRQARGALRAIEFDVNAKRGTLRVGPIRFSSGSNRTTLLATQAMEFGGVSTIMPTTRQRRRRARPIKANYRPRPYMFPAGEKGISRLRKNAKGMIT